MESEKDFPTGFEPDIFRKRKNTYLCIKRKRKRERERETEKERERERKRVYPPPQVIVVELPARPPDEML